MRAPRAVALVSVLTVILIGLAMSVADGAVLGRIVALCIVSAACMIIPPLFTGLFAAVVAVTAPGRWLVLFTCGLDRRDHTASTTDSGRSFWPTAARMLSAGPDPGIRFLVATTVTFFVGGVASCFPGVRAGLVENAWLWQTVTVSLLALVPLLAAGGIRPRHSTDRSIGGGTVFYLLILLASAITSSAALAWGDDSPVLFLWTLGVWATGTYEVVLRSQSRVELMTVPTGFERQLVLEPAPTPGEVSTAFVEHYWPYDPHVASGTPRETLDLWDAACPEFDWGRRSAGTEKLARAILCAFWGINNPHPRAVRRIMGGLLLGRAPDTRHVIGFAELVEAGLTSNEDFEMGRFSGPLEASIFGANETQAKTRPTALSAGDSVRVSGASD